MKMDIFLAIVVSAIVAIAFTATSESKSETLPSALGYKLETISGHDYLFAWSSDRGCCVIHAESCPCKSGKDTGGVR